MLTDGLEDIPGLVTPVVRPGRQHVFHQYTVRVTPEARLGRDELAQHLAASGIGSGVYYPAPVYAAPCYASRADVVVEPMPAAERAAREVLSLPVHPYLGEGDLERIVETVRRLLRS